MSQKDFHPKMGYRGIMSGGCFTNFVVGFTRTVDLVDLEGDPLSDLSSSWATEPTFAKEVAAPVDRSCCSAGSACKPEAAHFGVISGWHWLNVNKPGESVWQLDLEMLMLRQAQLVARSFRPF